MIPGMIWSWAKYNYISRSMGKDEKNEKSYEIRLREVL
jgi:hypothetical protein